MSAEELKIEENIKMKHAEDPQNRLILALVALYEASSITYPRQYVERRIQYKINVGRTREQAVEELCKEEGIHIGEE